MIIWDFLAAAWIIRIALNVLSYIQLWFVKEYRFDRMIIHLKTNQGKRLFLIPFRRPPVSPKSLFLFISFFIISAVFIIYSDVFILLKTAILDVLSFPLISCLVFFSKLPTFAYHRVLIRKAIMRLSEHKEMKVIAITGSYGKTSTKEILYTLLSQKYKTLKTEASKNSPIAIAEVILSKLKPDHEVFIVEMGAYKTGEIKKMSSMVHPQIGILTAINAQHQDLFGSMESTMKAKYELVQGLKHGGIVIANADNQYIKKMTDWAQRDGRTVYFYSLTQQNVFLHASRIHSTSRGVSFSVSYRNKIFNLAVHLFGVHQVSNILAAMAAALLCGMSVDEVKDAVRAIEPFNKIMHPIQGINGATFIDDTFNNNPDAAKAALSFLSENKSRKFFVFQPMVELGHYAQSSHEEVGKLAARVCDEILLTNDNFNESFMKGVESVRPDMNVQVLGGQKGADYLSKLIQKGDTVLFKGKEPGRILDLLVSRNK